MKWPTFWLPNSTGCTFTSLWFRKGNLHHSEKLETSHGSKFSSAYLYMLVSAPDDGSLDGQRHLTSNVTFFDISWSFMTINFQISTFETSWSSLTQWLHSPFTQAWPKFIPLKLKGFTSPSNQNKVRTNLSNWFHWDQLCCYCLVSGMKLQNSK